jgi:hypothetical protein
VEDIDEEDDFYSFYLISIPIPPSTRGIFERFLHTVPYPSGCSGSADAQDDCMKENFGSVNTRWHEQWHFAMLEKGTNDGHSYLDDDDC